MYIVYYILYTEKNHFSMVQRKKQQTIEPQKSDLPIGTSVFL